MSISRIPPLSSAETKKFYHDGTLPERFKDCESERRKRILEPYIHDDKPKEKSVYDYLKAGGFIDEEQSN